MLHNICYPIIILAMAIVCPFILYFIVRVVAKAVLDSIDLHFKNKINNHQKKENNVNQKN